MNMMAPRILEEIGARLSALAQNSPARDLEKNVRAMLTSTFSRLDLVTREEFDVQCAILAQTQAKLAELEARIVRLENERSGGVSGTTET